jgi:hypothetical protein
MHGPAAIASGSGPGAIALLPHEQPYTVGQLPGGHNGGCPASPTGNNGSNNHHCASIISARPLFQRLCCGRQSQQSMAARTAFLVATLQAVRSGLALPDQLAPQAHGQLSKF